MSPTLVFYIHSHLLIGNVIKTGLCKPFDASTRPETLQLLLNDIFGATNIMISFVTSNGIIYKPHVFILFNSDELLPVFWKVLFIRKSEHGQIFLFLNECETLLFDSHFNCYCISSTSGTYHIFELENLPYKSVFHVRRSFAKYNRLYIVLKCKMCI